MPSPDISQISFQKNLQSIFIFNLQEQLKGDIERLKKEIENAYEKVRESERKLVSL